MNHHQERFQQFLELLISLNSKKELFQLLELFLSPDEREDIAARYVIIKELLKTNKTQRQISKDLNVSIAKITRGSNELKKIDPTFLKKLKQAL